VEDFRNFRTKYAQSLHAGEALEKIADLDWVQIQSSKDPGVFTRYLDEHKGSSHTQEANDRIQSLSHQPPPSTPPPTPADLADWNKIKDTRDLNVLRDFRSKYQNSPKATEAFVRMSDIEWDSIHDSSKPEVFEDFMKKYPGTAHWTEASNRVEELHKQQQTAREQLEEQNQRDREAVRQTLDNYLAAYENKDLNRLLQIWPSLPSAIKQQLSLREKIRVVVDKVDPVINGDAATVSCTQTLEILPTGGGSRVFHQSLPRLFTLRRIQGKWIIEKDN
jgi:hypothetical protein